MIKKIAPIERKVVIALSLIATIVTTSTVGYHYTEGWTFFESLYFTIVTLSTVGYGDVSPQSIGGKIFTIFLIMGGVGVVAYAISSLTQIIIDQRIFRKNRMEKYMKKLTNHFIVCGFGIIGQRICKELEREDANFIVICNSSDILPEIENYNYAILKGDATDDEVLQKAGIKKAKGLVTVLPTDAENVFVTLTARGMNSNLLIVAKADIYKTYAKLKAAGADRVVSPYELSGYSMANSLLRPSVVDFIEKVYGATELDLQLEELKVAENSPLSFAQLKNTPILKNLGVIIIAIKRTDGDTIFKPSPEIQIKPYDTLIALGSRENLDKLTHQTRT